MREIYKPPVIAPHITPAPQKSQGTITASTTSTTPSMPSTPTVKKAPATKTRPATVLLRADIQASKKSPPPPVKTSEPQTLLHSLPVEILQYITKQSLPSERLSDALSATCQDFSYLRGHGMEGEWTVDKGKIEIFFRALSRGWDLDGLKSLTLRSNQFITGAQLKLLPKALTELTIQGGKLAKITPDDLSWVPRKTLTLHDVAFIDHVTFAALLSHPSATRLFLKNVQLEAPYRLAGPIEADFTSAVTELGFDDCGLSTMSLPFLLSLRNHITLLALNENNFNIAPQTPAAAQLVELFRMPSLKTLHFCEPRVDNAVLTQSLETTTVYSLTLRGITDIPISSILRNNTHLKSLNISNAAIEQNQLTDIKHIRNLTELDLQNCQLTDDHLVTLRGDDANNNTLQWIDLRRNPALTEDAINALCARFLRISAISDTSAAVVHVPGSKLDKINSALSEPSAPLTNLLVQLSRSPSPHDLRQFPVQLPDSVRKLTIASGNISFLPEDFLQNSSVTHFTARMGQISVEALAPLIRSKVLDLTFERCQLADEHLQAMAETSASNTVEGRSLNLSDNPGITPQGREAAIRTDPQLSLRHDGHVVLQAGGIGRFFLGQLRWNDPTVSDLKLVYHEGMPVKSGPIPVSTRNLAISYRTLNNTSQNVPPGAAPNTLFALSYTHVDRLLPHRASSVRTISLDRVMLDSDAFFAVTHSETSSLTLTECQLDYREFEELPPQSLDSLKRINADAHTLSPAAVLAFAEIFPTLSIYTPTHARVTSEEAARFFDVMLNTPGRYAQLQDLVLDLDPHDTLHSVRLTSLPTTLTAITIYGGQLIDPPVNPPAGVQLNHFPARGTAISDA